MLLVAVLTVAAFAAEVSAQQLVKKRIGLYSENGVSVVSEANTVIAVDLAVACQKRVVGPYARYAQKYFGERASLVDIIEYRIVDAASSVSEDMLSGDRLDCCEQSVVKSYMGGADEFAAVLPNRMSAVEKSVEEAAAEAAEQIYTLRRARFDLITGEMGDAVYGAGLESALREIDQMEQSLLELFYGKQSVTTTVERIYVPVEQNVTSYIIARFSRDAGLVSVDDLTGEIVLLSIAPGQMKYPEDKKKGKGKLVFRYANNATVGVSIGADMLSSTVLPIYEFGENVTYEIPRNKIIWTKPVE